jgi:hypothetical protein
MNHERLAAIVINRRMLVALVMGFSCGLPLLLTLSVLQAWMKEAGVDLTTIGLMSLVGLPYTLKIFLVTRVRPLCTAIFRAGVGDGYWYPSWR